MCLQVLFSTSRTSVEKQRLSHQTPTHWVTPPVSDALLYPGVLVHSPILVRLDAFPFLQLISGLPAAMSLLIVVTSPGYPVLDRQKLSEMQRYLITSVLGEQSRNYLLPHLTNPLWNIPQLVSMKNPNGQCLSQLNSLTSVFSLSCQSTVCLGNPLRETLLP